MNKEKILQMLNVNNKPQSPVLFLKNWMWQDRMETGPLTLIIKGMGELMTHHNSNPTKVECPAIKCVG